MGKGGAGHYVKMVHNGIEYADMQMIAELVHLLNKVYKLSFKDIAEQLKACQDGPLGSFLLDIAIDVLEKEEEGRPVLELILDKAKQKGTGTWTVQEALRLGAAVPSIAGAVFMRGASMQKESRLSLSNKITLQNPKAEMTLGQLMPLLHDATLLARFSHFDQGFQLLEQANKDMDYGFNFSEIARIWQGGCIIRAEMLRPIKEAFESQGDHLLGSNYAANLIQENLNALRIITAELTKLGIPNLAYSGGLAHIEAQIEGRSSAYMIQGLRDRFGKHGFERIDKEGQHHLPN